MISFGFSAFLVGGLMIAVPIILHLLKLKPRTPQGFPALVFLYATAAKKQNRNRLRKFIILLLRCLIFFLLAAAFAWPYISDINSEPEEAKVILWDNSFSMQNLATFQSLSDKASEIIDEADSKHPMLIGVVNESIKWSGNFSSDPNQLRDWLDSHNKSYGTSYFNQALRIADSKLKNTTASKKTIVLVTDKQFIPWENIKLNHPLSPGIDFKVIMPQSGKAANNTAITMIKTSDVYYKPKQKIKFKVSCRNYNSRNAKAELLIYLEDKLIGRKAIELPPNNLHCEDFNIKTPAGVLKPLSGRVELRTSGDDLIVDNIHYYNLNPVKKSEFYLTPLVDSNNFDFINAALRSDTSKIQIHEFNNNFKPKQEESPKLLIIQDLRAFDSNICTKLDKLLEAGGNVIIVWQAEKTTKDVLRHFGIKVTRQTSKDVKRFEMINFEHPVFKDYMQVRAGAWFDILFFKVPVLKFPENTQILATFDDNIPAITESRIKNGKLFVVATSLDRAHTNWPTFGSFLPFWRELLLYCSHIAGKSYNLRVCNGKKRWKNKVEVVSLSSKQNNAEFLSLSVPGNYLVKSENSEKIYSINVPSRESDTTPLPAKYDYKKLVSKEKMNNKKTSKALEKNNLQNLQKAESFWWICLVMALAFSIMETALSNRTAL
jgi:hypothetical protein